MRPTFRNFALDMEETKQPTAYRKSLHERIIDTAIKAFTAQGIKAVKMDDIAQTMGISKRTLYEIFENKEVLLLEVIRKSMAVKEREALEVVAGSSNVMDVILYFYKKKVEEFRVVNPVFYSDMARYPQVLELIDRDKQRNIQRQFDFIRRGVDEGYFRSDVDYRLALMMFDAMASYVLSRQLLEHYSIEEIFHNMFLVSLRGICTKRGQEVLEHFVSEL